MDSPFREEAYETRRATIRTIEPVPLHWSALNSTRLEVVVRGKMSQAMVTRKGSMRCLLLVAAVLLELPINAGDLGRADMANRNDLPMVSEFQAQCIGPMDRWEGPECNIRFTSKRMSVDNSLGISKEQVISFASHWGSDVRKYFDVLYRTSSGDISVSQFGFRHGNRAKQFVNTLAEFMSGKLSLPPR